MLFGLNIKACLSEAFTPMCYGVGMFWYLWADLPLSGTYLHDSSSQCSINIAGLGNLDLGVKLSLLTIRLEDELKWV